MRRHLIELPWPRGGAGRPARPATEGRYI